MIATHTFGKTDSIIRSMAEEMLNNILEWCFKYTNILQAKEDENTGKGFIHYVSEQGYTPVVAKFLAKDVGSEFERLFRRHSTSFGI